MIPVIEVSRLPSASSFYAAVGQPLGIRCLAPLPALPPSPSSSSSSSSSSFSPRYSQTLNFGSANSREPLFQLRQVTSSRNRPLQTCQLVLSADSLDAVNEFHRAALKTFPRSAAVIGTRDSLDISASATLVAAATSKPLDQNDVCARITDPDGNTMAVAYRPSYSYTSPYGGSSGSRRYQFGEPEPTRVISYERNLQADMTRSHSGSQPRYDDTADYYAEPASHSSPSARYPPGASLRRAATTSAVAYGPSQREQPKNVAGMLGMAAVGAVAGAAFTYSVMSGRSSRDRPLDESTAVPSFQRRSTFPDPYPTYAATRYSGQEGMRASSRKESREVDDLYDYDDGRSRHSSSRGYRASSRPGSRAVSEAPPGRAPLLLTDDQPRYSGSSYAPSRYDMSHAPSRHESRAPSRYEASQTPSRYEASRAPSRHDEPRAASHYDTPRAASQYDAPRAAPRLYDTSRAPSRHEPSHAPSHAPPLSRRSATFDVATGADRDSYVSSRSHRTGTTLRGSGNGGRQASVPPSASRSASVRHSTSRTGSYRSARDVPLPSSGVGSSHARWDTYPSDEEENDQMLFEDDNDSVAPDDSISCVGMSSRGQRYN